MVLRSLATILLFCAAAAPALAQATASAPLSDAAREEAKARFDLGTQLFHERKYREAIGEFQAAEAVKPDPAFDYDIAACYRKLGDLAAAKRFLERALIEAPPGSPYRERAAAELGEVDVAIETAKHAAGADNAPGGAGSAVPASRPATSTTPAVAPASSMPAPSAKEEPAAPAAPARDGAAPGAALTLAPPPPSSPAAAQTGARRWPIWIASGAAAALLAGGATFAVLAQQESDRAHGFLASSTVVDAALAASRRDAYLADGLLAGGLAAAGAATWLYLREGSAEPRAAAMAAPTPSGGAVVLVFGEWSRR